MKPSEAPKPQPTHSRTNSTASSTSTELTDPCSPVVAPSSPPTAATLPFSLPEAAQQEPISAKIAALASDLGAANALAAKAAAAPPPAPRPPPVSTPSAASAAVSTASPAGGPSSLGATAEAVESFDMSANVDDFLEELRRALDESVTDEPPSQTGSPAAPPVGAVAHDANAHDAVPPPAPASPHTQLDGHADAAATATAAGGVPMAVDVGGAASLASPLCAADMWWRTLESPSISARMLAF